jgi:5-methylcytosine-specific restriction enzyme B
MNKQQGMEIIERLRQAASAGAPVVELVGDDAKNFVFVKDRKVLLGSFGIEADRKFFVSVVSGSSNAETFQMLVYEKLKGNPVLASSYLDDTGIVWTYQATKQKGDNQARKKAFFNAAKGESISFPLPSGDVTEFSKAINRAIELRALADSAGGVDDDDDTEPSNILEQLYPSKEDRFHAAFSFSRSIRRAHELNAKSWCVTNPGGTEKVRLNVGVLRVLDLLPGKVRLIVDPSKVPDSVRTKLGEAFEAGDPDAKAPYAKVTLAASEMPTLAPELLLAHETFLAAAAGMSSPFAGNHHQPAIVEALEEVIGEPLPKPATSQTRYWKVSPGENGEMWEECRDGGFIAMGWDKLGDLTNVDHEEFKKRVEEVDASDQVWKFRNIEVGDRIVANNGISRVLGIGTVTGSYYFATGKKRAHRLPVRWDDTTERVVEMKGWRKTLIRLNQDTFKQLEAAPTVGSGKSTIVLEEEQAGPEGGIDFEGILSQLSSNSLSFSAELVASYLLALQAKRFVLLTGISGTGKTKLAQEVARLFGPTTASTPNSPSENSDAFEVTAKPYQIKYGRLVVPAELAQEFDALTDLETKRIDLKVPGQPMASMALYKAADRASLFYVTLSGDAKAWFKTNIKLGDRFLLSRQTSGDREWLDLKLPEAGQRSPSRDVATYELISVRPDWTDSRELLGFYNPLTKTYLSKPTLQLLLRAQAEVAASSDAAPPRPFFLIFDEMNLARVEHYFSDFLSAMESGEAIHLHDDAHLEEEEGLPRRILIPKNVFVIGTVNVDETTYMFSPKVLDRAFVLEFNEVNLDGLASTIKAEEAESTPLALTRMEGGLKLRGPATDAEWLRFEKVLNGTSSALLRTLHAELAIENRHFGYRVAREIARFVDLAMEQTEGCDNAAKAALDVAVLSKILPKLHGSQAEVEQIFKRLMVIALGSRSETEVFSPEGSIAENVAFELPLPRTARKLWRMQRRLRAHGFVSFIE